MKYYADLEKQIAALTSEQIVAALRSHIDLKPSLFIVTAGDFNKSQACRQPMKRERSREQFAQAKRLIPGGVNSPARAFGGVGGEPIFFERGEGPYLYDIDGNRYIDYIGSWGPMILGHAHPEVVAAVQAAAAAAAPASAPRPRPKANWPN